MGIKRLVATILLLGVFLVPAHASAAVPILKDVCNQAGADSSVCKDYESGTTSNPLYGPKGIISRVVSILSFVVGIAAVVGIIVAGIRYMASGSSPEEANKARELVIYAVVGLILATAAQVIVRTVLYNINV